jgi:hypothetical protein
VFQLSGTILNTDEMLQNISNHLKSDSVASVTIAMNVNQQQSMSDKAPEHTLTCA